MARRSDHTPEELKKLSIVKGLEIIDKKGLYGFSARAAAAAMGYTVGTLYHVFGSLDQYLLHLNGQILDDWYAELAEGLAATRKDPLRYLVQAYVDFARTKNERWNSLFGFRLASTAMPGWYGEKLLRLFALVEEALAPHMSGDMNKRRRAAKVLWAGIHGICVLSLSGKLDIVGADKTEVLVDSLMDTYLKGLAAT